MPRTKRRKRKSTRWSYNAGRRGHNWVRVFQERDGRFYYEYFELTPERDLETGEERTVRKRRSKVLKNVTDRKAAEAKADQLAGKFAQEDPLRSGLPLTIGNLMDLYNKEASPKKGQSKQAHDACARRVFLAFFDAQPESERRLGRHPSSLDQIDWKRFIELRGTGQIPGWPKAVRDRQVAYDLKYLVSVLNFAVGTKRDDQSLLPGNPWGPEIRRTQRMIMPKESSPRRPVMTDGIRDGLITHAPSWRLEAALILQRETRRRNSSIRQLVWSDIDQDRWEVTWRHTTDKSRRQNVTPLTGVAVEVFKALPSRGIGNAPVFPSPTDESQAMSRHEMQTELKRAKKSWLGSVSKAQRPGLTRRLFRVGFHSEKRAGVRDDWFRSKSATFQEEFSGTNWQTLHDVYDHMDVDDMRAEMQTKDRNRTRGTSASRSG